MCFNAALRFGQDSDRIGIKIACSFELTRSIADTKCMDVSTSGVAKTKAVESLSFDLVSFQ